MKNRSKRISAEENVPESLSARYDARVISLYSRGPRADQGLLQLDDPNCFYTFNYYDGIQIEPVKLDSTSPLLAAYQRTRELRRDEANPSPQILLAFTDLTGKYAYSREAVEAFWADTSYPILFMSMAHLEDSTQFELLLDKIQAHFPQGKCFVYFTFDHSDLLIFYKACSFEEYTTCIMKLNYVQPRILRDSFTLYCFSCLAETYSRQEFSERFGAHLKLGIADYEAWTSFRDKVLFDSPEITYSWLLGRNDVSLFHPNADLNWLRKIRSLAIEGAPWYTTCDLSILVAPKDDLHLQMDKPSAEGKQTSGLEETPKVGKLLKSKIRSYLDSQYKTFCAAYCQSYERLKIVPDRVWLRWLFEAYTTATSLLESALASDLGICLVPQFLDFFSYTLPLLECVDLEKKDMDSIQECFSTFFTNISTLIDSTTHSSRQFIQVPAFQSASFEMPPKIMAYYVAVGHRLISVLQDTKANYGFTISPSFVPTLSVSPLGEVDTDGCEAGTGEPIKWNVQDNKFLSIAVDERALYTLQQTTETFAHEISHFVGDTNRCRPERKAHILLFVLEEFLEKFLLFYSDVLQRDCPVPSWSGVLPLPFTIDQNLIQKYASMLLAKLQTVEGYYCNSETFYMMTEVQGLINQLLQYICGDYELKVLLTNFIWEDLFEKQCEPRDHWKYMRLHLGFQSSGGQWLKDSIIETEQEQIRFEVRSTCRKALKEYIDAEGIFAHITGISNDEAFENYQCAASSQEKADDICYNFKETFADLQAILLLNMKWKDYDQLLRDDLSDEIPTRKLAVARALIKLGHWHQEELTVCGSSVVRQLISVDPTDATNISTFRQANINRRLLHHLSEYLTVCARTIQNSFNNPNRSKEVGALRRVYKLVSQYGTVLEVETGLMSVILDFRRNMENQVVTGDEALAQK